MIIPREYKFDMGVYQNKPYLVEQCSVSSIDGKRNIVITSALTKEMQLPRAYTRLSLGVVPLDESYHTVEDIDRFLMGHRKVLLPMESLGILFRVKLITDNSGVVSSEVDCYTPASVSDGQIIAKKLVSEKASSSNEVAVNKEFIESYKSRIVGIISSLAINGKNKPEFYYNRTKEYTEG